MLRFVKLRAQLLSAIFAITLAPYCEAQEPEESTGLVTIKFRIFDANIPTRNCRPRPIATVQYRILGETRFDDPRSVEVNGPDADEFYSVMVQKGRVINRLTIVIDAASVNPAVINKVVAANDMVLYPGALDSSHDFGFPAYMAQMGEYRDLHAEFVEGVTPGVREVNLNTLRDLFKVQLQNMAIVRLRLPGATEEQIAQATRLANDVLQRFGLPHGSRMIQPPYSIDPCPPCRTLPPHCGPKHKFFGKRRCQATR